MVDLLTFTERFYHWTLLSMSFVLANSCYHIIAREKRSSGAAVWWRGTVFIIRSDGRMIYVCSHNNGQLLRGPNNNKPDFRLKMSTKFHENFTIFIIEIALTLKNLLKLLQFLVNSTCLNACLLSIGLIEYMWKVSTSKYFEKFAKIHWQLYSRLYRLPTTVFSISFVFRGFWQATDNSFEFSKEFLTDFQYNME